MADDEPPREGIVGWGRLGCLWVVLAVVPLWVTLIGAFAGARPPWLVDRGLEEATLLGISYPGWFAFLAGTASLGVLLALVFVGLSAVTVIGRWRGALDTRATIRRWDAVIGDGDELRPDAWGAPAPAAAVPPPADERTDDDPTDHDPTDPRVGGPGDR